MENNKVDGLKKAKQTRIMRIMKMCLLFVALGIGSSFATNTYSQETFFTLEYNNRTVKEVFNEIERRSEYIFFYIDNSLNLKRKVSVKVENQQVDALLDQVFAGTSNSYHISDRQIIITRKAVQPVVPAEAPELMQQGRRISGVVKDASGEPVIGANVVVKGTTNGIISDVNGNFTLNVDEGAVLRISFIGYISQEVPVGNKTNLQITLAEDNQALSEVVVTALGIKKEKIRVTYAIQEVKGADLTKARESNALSGLTGKVAGLQIANSTNLFANPEISLRGVAPLIVVDGVPLESDSWNLSSDDIESFSVLKGPSASVLYGSRGKNGAIQITTKRGGDAAKKGYSVEFNSSTMIESSFLTFPETNHAYGSGQNGQYRYGNGTGPSGGGVNDDSFYIWGPKLDVLNSSTPSGYNETEQWDSPIDPVTGKRIPTALRSRGKNNLENFLEDGVLSTNNLSINANFDKGDLRFSATQVYEKGMVPNTGVNITTMNFSGGLNVTDKLRLETNITYNKQYSENYPDPGYGPHNFIYGIAIWAGPEVDIRDFKNYWVPGREGIQQLWYENIFYNNPYFISNEYLRGYYRDNTYGSFSAKYTFAPGIELMARTHVNNYSLYRSWKYPSSYKSGDFYKNSGAYEELYQTFFENNSDLLLTVDRDFLDDFNFSGMLGGNYRSYNSHQINARTSSMNIPEWYNLSNSADQVQPSNEIRSKKAMSAYGTGEVSYKRAYFLNFSGRWDKTSTLPVAKNNYFYPSVGGSLILSRALTLPEVISFTKIRGSYAKVGSDLDIYQTSPFYSAGTPPVWNGQRSLYYATTENNPMLEPEFSSSFEIGGEMQFLQNRVGFDLSYFESIDGPQIFQLPVSVTTGKSSRQVNGREYKRSGWEVVLTGKPVRNADGLNWDVMLNWSTYKVILNKIYGDQTTLNFISIGERADAMYYQVTEKSPDGQVVHENGRPKYNPSTIKDKVGYYNPDWIAGMINTFSYKNFKLTLQIDGRVGGDVYSSMNALLWESGRHPNSVNQWRDDYNEGNRTYIGEGVKVIAGELKRDGDGNVISDTREFAQNDVPVSYFDYVQNWNARGCYESNMFKKTFIKLREATLTYNFSQDVLRKSFIKQASISLIGRNLLYFADFKYTDMDAVTGSSDALQTPSVRRWGVNLNLTF